MVRLVEDYIKLCNYNPLSMLSPAVGLATMEPIDAVLDRDYSLRSVGSILLSPITFPAGLCLISLELLVDFIFRPLVGMRKLENLVKLARKHNKLTPAKSFDICWSHEAEAYFRCLYGGSLVRLQSMDTTICDDFSDVKIDKGPNNAFHLPREEVYEIFREEGIEKDLSDVRENCPQCGRECAVYNFFGMADPISTYEELRKKLS